MTSNKIGTKAIQSAGRDARTAIAGTALQFVVAATVLLLYLGTEAAILGSLAAYAFCGMILWLAVWIALELEVHGGDKMIFRVNGEDVFELEQPRLDPGDKRDDYAAKKLVDARGGETLLTGGYIALQAEGAPLEFRNIRIRVLDE